jgi:hypothetical protein
MTTPGEVYQELGGDWFTKHDNPERRKARLIAQLHKPGLRRHPHPRRLNPTTPRRLPPKPA